VLAAVGDGTAEISVTTPWWALPLRIGSRVRGVVSDLGIDIDDTLETAEQTDV